MQNKLYLSEHLGEILAKARNDVGKSQKYMAKAIGKSVGTIQNWEGGYATPNVIDMISWFDVLGLNTLRYFLDYLYPNSFYQLDGSAGTESVKESLLKYIDEIACDSEIRKLAFCIFGNTGSSWESQLDMLTAHNHTTLRSRVNAAQVIMDSYDMEKARNELMCTDHIMPNEDGLREAIKLGKESVFKGHSGYSE